MKIIINYTNSNLINTEFTFESNKDLSYNDIINILTSNFNFDNNLNIYVERNGKLENLLTSIRPYISSKIPLVKLIIKKNNYNKNEDKYKGDDNDKYNDEYNNVKDDNDEYNDKDNDDENDVKDDNDEYNDEYNDEEISKKMEEIFGEIDKDEEDDNDVKDNDDEYNDEDNDGKDDNNDYEDMRKKLREISKSVEEINKEIDKDRDYFEKIHKRLSKYT